LHKPYLCGALAAASFLAGVSCRSTMKTIDEDHRDSHSYARPEEVRVRHVELDLEADFAQKVLRGTATLSLKRAVADAPLRLDTEGLSISRVETSRNGRDWADAKFELGPADKILGTALTVPLPAEATLARVHYVTGPKASALQWLEPAQTAGKKLPFLFTQSEAIHARSWIPLQDSPGVRITYSAHIRTPKELMAVMSAEQDPQGTRDGDYFFRLRQPVAPYLIALAIGDLVFQPMSERTGVWAEPSVVAKAAAEFNDTEKMMQAVESLYGPYQWERYDLLVLPPSFPYGGMENPKLTFATPTVLAGDKSLVALVAHELAHSWSGNLVTNATWRDFWLNEGFTVYLERRIQEKVFGQQRAEMEEVNEINELSEEMKRLAPADQILHIDLKGRDPDEGSTQVPYVKGSLFLRQLEQTFGREKFDEFLRGYFTHFQFQSITTGDFVAYLHKNLLDASPELSAKIPLDEWLTKPGMPAGIALPHSEAFAKVAQLASAWIAGSVKTAELPAKTWSTQEWVYFLREVAPKLDASKMRDLDDVFHLTAKANSEVSSPWLVLAARYQYAAANARLEEYLITVGRMRLIEPVYRELAKTVDGKKKALAIYAKAKPGYHPLTVVTVETLLKP
jgi:leukotriene-A4 hydrolase